MRKCAGGELFEHIGKRAAFTEAAAADVARSLLQYLAHIHGLGVAHMDIVSVCGGGGDGVKSRCGGKYCCVCVD